MLISAHAVPCAKNGQWFNDRIFNRILHSEHPGSSRLYAIPLGSGEVSIGDPVTVEP
jgi:MOSC domain-containing protein YiiM